MPCAHNSYFSMAAPVCWRQWLSAISRASLMLTATPYRAVAAACVHRDQDRQPQLGVVLDLDRESGRRRRLGLLRGPCHLLVSFARPFITLNARTIKAILHKGTDLYSARFQRDAAQVRLRAARGEEQASAEAEAQGRPRNVAQTRVSLAGTRTPIHAAGPLEWQPRNETRRCDATSAARLSRIVDIHWLSNGYLAGDCTRS